MRASATEAAPRVFALFRDTPRRRAALGRAPGSAERYCLYGLDQLQSRGLAVENNLESPVPAWAQRAGVAAHGVVRLIGMYARTRVRTSRARSARYRERGVLTSSSPRSTPWGSRSSC
jgi:hypothetical protein